MGRGVVVVEEEEAGFVGEALADYLEGVEVADIEEEPETSDFEVLPDCAVGAVEAGVLDGVEDGVTGDEFWEPGGICDCRLPVQEIIFDL